MKKELSTPILIAVVTVVVIVVALLGWSFLGSHSDTQSADAVKAHVAFKEKKEGG